MNKTYVSDFNVCSFTCFDDMMFHREITIEDEAEAVDNSRELNFNIAESKCVWKLKVVMTEEKAEKRMASVLPLFCLSLFSSTHSPISLAQF